jgi:hypothetical protein
MVMDRVVVSSTMKARWLGERESPVRDFPLFSTAQVLELGTNCVGYLSVRLGAKGLGFRLDNDALEAYTLHTL